MNTSPSSVTETILGTPTSHGNFPSSNRFPLYHRAFDGGAGAGGGQGQGQGTGQGAGSGGAGGGQAGGQGQGQAGGAGGQGSGQPQAAKFDPNATYDFGDGKPVKGSDYLAGFMPKATFEKGRTFLEGEAKKLEAAWAQIVKQMPNRQGQGQGDGQGQGQGQGQGGRRQNPMDRFKDVPIVDGTTLNEAYQAMVEGDIRPMMTQLGQVTKIVSDQQKIIQQLRQGYGSINEGQATQRYEATIATSLEGLGFDANVMKAHPILRDIAEDVYQSHNPEDWDKNPAEFPKLLKSRIDGLMKFVKAVQKAEVETERNKVRHFTRPGGNVQPGQEAKYQHENGSSLARRFFSQLDSSRA